MSDIGQKNPSSERDDEIDLRELFVALWRRKLLITICVIAAIALAALYLRSAERKYTVSYVFAPVASENSGPNLGGLGGLASLAGVSLPSSSSGDFLTFKFLLPNGESTAADEESIIPPGAVIVVPPKADRLTVLGLTDIVSRVLGDIATSVLAINNVR